MAAHERHRAALDRQQVNEPVAYLNGAWLPASEARVSVLDRGFLYADGVYEVVPVYGGRPFRLHPHLARLARSNEAIGIAPSPAVDWEGIVTRLVHRHGGGDRIVYLQVTRGAGDKRAHAFPENAPPTVFAMCSPWPALPPEALEAGVGAITLPDLRWLRCDIKSIALLPNVMAAQQAKAQACNEAIQYRGDHITEGASSNVFAVVAGRLVTPPKGPEILPGITRDLVLELLEAGGVPCFEEGLLLSDLRRADEIWLTSSTRELLPVTRLDGAAVGAGRPGPLWAQAFRLFQAHKDSASAHAA